MRYFRAEELYAGSAQPRVELWRVFSSRETEMPPSISERRMLCFVTEWQRESLCSLPGQNAVEGGRKASPVLPIQTHQTEDIARIETSICVLSQKQDGTRH